MVVKKVKSRSGLIYKITASYSPKFGSTTDAKRAISKLSQNERATVGKIKKMGNLYTLLVKFTYYVANADAKNAAVKTAKSNGANVTVSKVKR